MLLHLQEAPAGKVKRPPNAYSKYVADNFASAQAANPELKGVGAVGKVLGKQWAELPEAQKVGFRVQSGNVYNFTPLNKQ
jgi:HMG (high mobility group) box